MLDKPPVSICVLPEYNLKIEYPINWIKLDRKNLPDPINIAFMSPPPKSTPFSISESEGLFLSIMHPQSGRKTLENWVNGDTESMKLQFPDFTIHDSFPRTISSTDGQTTPAYQLVYSQCDLKTLLVMAIKDEKAYQFNYSSTFEKYEIFFPVIEQMICSIEFLS